MRRSKQSREGLFNIGFIAALFVTAGCATTDASDLIAEAPEKPTPAAGAVAEVKLTAPAAPEDAPITELIGTYEWVGGKPEQQAVWRKIEGIASSFNLFAQGIVRSKLAESNQIAKQIRIEADSETLVIYHDAKNASAPLDGSPTKFKAINGEEMDLSFKVEPKTIQQTFAGKGKGQVNSYTLDGDTLTVHVSIKANQLPRELAYDLTYKRVPASE
jgi:hypothetical protein